MESINAFTLTFVLLTTLFNTALFLNGESRIDAYVALSILSYYVSYGLFLRETHATTAQKAVNAFFLIVFLLIVAYRVLLVIRG